MFTNVFVVALGGPPAQNRGLPTKKKGLKVPPTSDKRHTSAPHTRDKRNTAVRYLGNSSRDVKGWTEEGGGTLDHSRLPTKVALQQQRGICDSMHVSQNSRDPQLYRSRGPIKSNYSIN